MKKIAFVTTMMLTLVLMSCSYASQKLTDDEIVQVGEELFCDCFGCNSNQGVERVDIIDVFPGEWDRVEANFYFHNISFAVLNFSGGGDDQVRGIEFYVRKSRGKTRY